MRNRNALSIYLLTTTLLFAACGNEGEGAQGGTEGEGSGAASASEASAQQAYDLTQIGFDEGSQETALVGIVEFSDFGCGHCAGFHEEDYPELRQEFVAGGEVLWKYIPITIGGFENGNLAGAAGVCAQDLGAFPEMRDLLFEHQAEWQAAPASDATGIFARLAGEAGLDDAAFRACLESEDPHVRILANNEVARGLGVNATPSFVIQESLIRGRPPLEQFQSALRTMLNDLRAAREEVAEPTP